MVIIALSGWKGSGKDTVSNRLVDKYGFRRLAFADLLKDRTAQAYGFPREYCDLSEYKEHALLQYPVAPRDAFARMVCDFMLREFRTLDGRSGLREALYTDQSDGTYHRRPAASVHDSNISCQSSQLYWTPRALCILEGSVKRAADPTHWTRQTLSAIADPDDHVVVSDLRYEAEAAQVKLRGQALQTPAHLVRIKRFAVSPSLDPSEHDLDTFAFDHWLDNTTGTCLSDLHQRVDELMATLEVKPVT
jgi:hypothetical protein